MDLKNAIPPAAAAVLLATSVALPVAGFTTEGIAKGSLAAAAHASIGNVATGSGFATLMSMAAKGAALKAGGAGAAIVLLKSMQSKL